MTSRRKDGMTTCRSEGAVTMDLCRTGGCCPTATVFKDRVELEIPTAELGTVIRDGRTFRVLRLDKAQIDLLALEMRRRQ